MSVQKIAITIGVLLMLITTGMEVRNWMSTTGTPAERKQAAFISLLNVLAVGLVMFSQV